MASWQQLFADFTSFAPGLLAVFSVAPSDPTSFSMPSLTLLCLGQTCFKQDCSLLLVVL